MTILLITSEVLIRADFKGRGTTPTKVWRQPAPATDSLVALTEAAWVLGPRRRTKIWVMSSTLWTDAVTLPDGAGAGLSDTELTQALRFEAESLSGIPGAASQVAYRRLNGGQCLVSQVSRQQLLELSDLLGKHFAGLLNPAALPTAWPSESGGAWARQEHWPELHLDISGQGRKLERVEILVGKTNMTGNLEHPIVDFRESAAPEGAVDGIHGDGVETFLGHWAECLRQGLPGHAIIKPPPRPVSSHRKTGISLALAALVGLGCYGHWTSVKAAEQRFRQSITAEQQPREDYEDAKRAVDKARRELAELESTRQGLRDERAWRLQALGHQHERTLDLLTSLAAISPDSVLLTEIRVYGEHATLSGLSSQADAPNNLSLALSDESKGTTWHVSPPRKSLHSDLPNGQCWRFTLEADATLSDEDTPR